MAICLSRFFTLRYVTSLDDKIVHGIDGVYENASPPPKYIIGEAKYGGAQLSNTKTGRQMSDEWIESRNRLDKAVGQEKLLKLEWNYYLTPENIESLLVRVGADGKVSQLRFWFGVTFLSVLMIVSIENTLFFDGNIRELRMMYNEKGELKVAPFSPSSKFWFGSDAKGRDLFQLIIEGAKWTVGASIVIAVLRVVIGSLYLTDVTKSFIVIPNPPSPHTANACLSGKAIFPASAPGKI